MNNEYKNINKLRPQQIYTLINNNELKLTILWRSVGQQLTHCYNIINKLTHI